MTLAGPFRDRCGSRLAIIRENDVKDPSEPELVVYIAPICRKLTQKCTGFKLNIQCKSMPCGRGEIGRRKGLKILRLERAVPVRPRPPAPFAQTRAVESQALPLKARHHLSSLTPKTYPTADIARMASGYQVHTKSGLSSVQFAA
jgi:hypothetical protein